MFKVELVTRDGASIGFDAEPSENSSESRRALKHLPALRVPGRGMWDVPSDPQGGRGRARSL